MGFSTDAIHVGQEPDALTGSIVAPIYQTSTYVIEEMGKSKGYDYARTNHPNRKALERTIAKLENGHAAYVFTSGMAGIDAVFRLLRPGDHTILSQAVYGGVFRITTQLLVEFGLRLTYSIGLIAGINFLGLGLQPPQSDWGLMINDNRLSLTVQPWGVLLPIIGIAVLTIGANLLTDAYARAAIGINRGED